MKKLISAIVPCYNEEESLPIFYKTICEVAAKLQEAFPDTEIVLSKASRECMQFY